MLIIVVAAAALLWLLLGNSKPASAGVISNPGDFDPTTSSQIKGAAAGDVSIGDEWSATFIPTEGGTGNWDDRYKTNANSVQYPILAPNTDDKLLLEMANAGGFDE